MSRDQRERLGLLDQQRRQLYELLSQPATPGDDREAPRESGTDPIDAPWKRWAARESRPPSPNPSPGLPAFLKAFKPPSSSGNGNRAQSRAEAADGKASTNSSLVRLKPSGTRPPLFLVHPVLGTAFQFKELAQHFDPERPLYALKAKGLDGVDPPLTSFTAMATHYADAIGEARPHGRIHLGGYSLGSYIAFEVARELLARDREVGRILVLGLGAPISALLPRVHEEASFWVQYAEDFVRVITQSLKFGGLNLNGVTARIPPQLRVALANIGAFTAYAPQPIDHEVDLFITREQEPQLQFRPLLGWETLALGGVKLHRLPGNHLSMLEAKQAAAVAATLTTILGDHDGDN